MRFGNALRKRGDRRGGKAETHGIHQQLETGKATGLRKVEFRNFVRLHRLQRLDHADFVVPEWLFKSPQLETPKGSPILLSDGVRANDAEPISSRQYSSV